MNEFNELLKQFKSLEFSELILNFVPVIIWIVFILISTWLLRKGLERTIKDNTMRYRARKIIRLVSYVLVFLVIISYVTQVQYFSIAIGLFSAGLAFALQEVILSIAGWISIFSSELYKPGDRIEINNVKGDVIDISILRTTLMEIGEWVNSDNYNGRIVQVSNSQVFKGFIRNYSTDFPFLWDEITLPIRYGSDIQYTAKTISETAESVLNEYAEYASQHWKKMVKKYLIENANVHPTLTLHPNDNWVQFNLRFVVDYKSRRTTKDKLYKAILEAVEKAGEKITLASTSLEVIGMPKIQVDIDQNTKSNTTISSK